MSTFSNLRSSILVHITKANAAISILQQGRMRVGKNDPSWTKNQMQMLGEGVYLGRSYSICLGKVRKLLQSEGVATVVSIVNLGEIYETERRQHYLSGKLLQSNGLNFHSTRCLGKNIATGTEYCIYDPDRITPLFAWIQAQNDEYFLVRSDDGIYRYDNFPVNKLIIKMTNENILLSDGNNPPFNKFTHKEPLLGKRTIIFHHLYDFYFGKIIQRNLSIDLSNPPLLVENKIKHSDYNYTGDECAWAVDDNELQDDHGVTQSDINKPVDIIFVLDATQSTAKNFNNLILLVKQLHDFFLKSLKNASLYTGSVIYRNSDSKTMIIDPNHEFVFNDYERKRKEELQQKNLYFEDLELLRKEQFSTHDTVLYPYNRISVIDLFPVIYETFPNVTPKFFQILNRLNFSKNKPSQLFEIFLKDPTRGNFTFDGYKAEINSEGNRVITNLEGKKATYISDRNGKMILDTDDGELALYLGKTKVSTYKMDPPVTYALVTELEKVIHNDEIKDDQTSVDWAPVLKSIMKDVSWRQHSWKLVIWLGSNDSIETNESQRKIEKYVTKMAQLKMNFLGINTKTNSSGCQYTFSQMNDIYDATGGEFFKYQDINESFNESMNFLIDNFYCFDFKTIKQTPMNSLDPTLSRDNYS